MPLAGPAFLELLTCPVSPHVGIAPVLCYSATFDGDACMFSATVDGDVCMVSATLDGDVCIVLLAAGNSCPHAGGGSGGVGGVGGGGWGGNEVMFLRVLVLQSLLSSSELLPRTQSPWQTILFGAGRGGGLSRFACSCRHYYIRVEWLGRGKSRGRVACALSN